ncbi:acyltransferase, partial [Actinoplanes sp. ATCC 53533]
FDTLRAVALVRVVVYHMFPLPWLAMVFPSMGVMFALGGSLMATSMRRSTEQAITGRLRRLLPALWVMGALLLPVMLVAGWQDRPQWPALLLWLVPIVEPPTAGWAEPVTGVLWYLVAYLWLVLLSPLLLRCYQRARLMTVGTPIAGLATLENAPPILGEALGSAATDVLTFMSCWVLGFAHRGGDLKRIHLGVLIPLAATLVGAGLAWEITHPGDDGVDLSAEPVAYA